MTKLGLQNLKSISGNNDSAGVPKTSPEKDRWKNQQKFKLVKEIKK